MSETKDLASGAPRSAIARLMESLQEMQQASDLIDESYGGSDYNARLIALALIAREFLRRDPDAALRACAEARPSTEQGWQPIETAPKDDVALFWVVPKTPEEAYCNTSGDPIFGTFAPYIFMGKSRTWSSLSKAIHWLPLPAPPRAEALAPHPQHVETKADTRGGTMEISEGRRTASQGGVASGPAPNLTPRERAEQALTILAHETGTATIRLSGLTLADVTVDLATRLADAIADAEEAITREWAERVAAGHDRERKLLALLQAQPEADSAEILPAERSTFDRPRDRVQELLRSAKSSAGRAAALDAAPSRSTKLDQALEALAFAEGAILDAIGLEDGLDGRAGEAVLKMIRAALIANGQQPITIPPEDEPGDPPYQTTEQRLAAALARSAPAEKKDVEKNEDDPARVDSQ